MGVDKPQIGMTLHYVSRGSADGVYPPVHVPFLVVSVDEVAEDIGAAYFETDEAVVPFQYLVSGWTFNSHGQRYEEDVIFLEDVAHPATCHWPERV